MRSMMAASLALGLAGCMSTPPDGGPGPAPERQVSYVCDRGPGVTVVFAGDTARIVGPDGQAVVMARRPSASGFWYESPTHTLRGKGGEATYTIGRMAPMRCRVG